MLSKKFQTVCNQTKYFCLANQEFNIVVMIETIVDLLKDTIRVRFTKLNSISRMLYIIK